MSKVKFLSKGQITIPGEVRNILKLKPKDTVVFLLNEHKEVRLVKLDKTEITLDSKSTVTDKGQVTIPSKIRDDLKLETGDFLIFSFVNESIFIRKEGQMVPCCACNATGQYEDYGLPCFICDQTSFIENHDNGILFLLLFKNNFRKYNVALNMLQHEVKKNNVINYFQFPKLTFRSTEYPIELLNRIQDKLQMKLIEEYAPKSSLEPSKFLIPNDIALKEILDLFSTDEAKTIVTDWFRFERTV